MQNKVDTVQDELDLTSGTAPQLDYPAPRSLDKRIVLAVFLAVAVVLWGAWMTKTVIYDAPQGEIKSVELQPIIQEYVQAQSRSDSDVATITLETEKFMAVLEEELKNAGSNGDTIVVAEAVLSKNVPDITPKIKRAVYDRVSMPKSIPIDQRATDTAPRLPPNSIGEGNGG